MQNLEEEKVPVGRCLSGEKATRDQFVLQYPERLYNYMLGSLRGCGETNVPKGIKKGGASDEFLESGEGDERMLLDKPEYKLPSKAVMLYGEAFIS